MKPLEDWWTVLKKDILSPIAMAKNYATCVKENLHQQQVKLEKRTPEGILWGGQSSDSLVCNSSLVMEDNVWPQIHTGELNIHGISLKAK